MLCPQSQQQEEEQPNPWCISWLFQPLVSWEGKSASADPWDELSRCLGAPERNALASRLTVGHLNGLATSQ
jgi:hypothetical protein